MGRSGARSFFLLTAAGAAVCALAVATASGCGSSSPAGGGATHDGGGGHDATAADAPTAMDGAPTNDGSANDGSANDGSANDAAGDAGALVTVIPPVAIPQNLDALGANTKTGTIYAAVQGGLDAGDSIVVINASTNTVTTTIPPVAFDGGSLGYLLLAADETNDLLYAVDPSINSFENSSPPPPVISVFNGATNAYVTSFNVEALDPQCAEIDGIAVDGARLRLYLACTTAAFGAEASVISTAGGTYSFVTSIALPDLGSNGSQALALDTTSQLLYVAAQVSVSAFPVDQIDTATNAENTAAQQNLGGGNMIAMAGTAASAMFVMANPDAGPGGAAERSSPSIPPRPLFLRGPHSPPPTSRAQTPQGWSWSSPMTRRIPATCWRSPDSSGPRLRSAATYRSRRSTPWAAPSSRRTFSPTWVPSSPARPARLPR